MDLIEKISLLSSKYEQVTLYKPAILKNIMRCENKLPGVKFPNEIIDFYRFSNGASFLDYCFAGCKNQRIVDIAENTLELWGMNIDLVDDFVGFITTSSGQNFGYLMETRNSKGGPVVAFYDTNEEQLLVVSSSMSLFFADFISRVDETLRTYPKSLYVVDEKWPCNLFENFSKDHELLRMYESGKLSNYYADDLKTMDFVDYSIKLFSEKI